MGVGERRDPPLSLPQLVPGGMARLASAIQLLNACPVPPGVHHDVENPIPVVATPRWATGPEETDTLALEWWRALHSGPVVRVRVIDLRVMTGAVWLPAADVRRRTAPQSNEGSP